MKNATIKVVYHSGKDDLKELITKLVEMKITSEQNLRKLYNYNSYAAVIPSEKQE